MAHKLINLTLPPFAFLDSANDTSLEGRNVILHVRSASVIEILADDQLPILKGDVITYEFDYGLEHNIAVLHYSAILEDKDDIVEQIMKPCADWFCQYCEWEDNNIVNDDLSHNN